jgi:flagellar biosynthesis protein FlhG
MRPAGAARWVGVVSGKGGVGKTNVAVNLAVATAGLGAKVLLVDGDLGLANVDVLLGLRPAHSALDVLEGRCTLSQALVEGPRGIHVLAAASGRAELPGLRPRALAPLLVPLYRAAGAYDLVLLDVGAGIGAAALGLAAACDRALLVTTPDPTALADAYATLKVLGREAPDLPLAVVVNEARHESQARDTHRLLERLARRFLGTAPPFLGHLPRDARLAQAVRQQRAVVELFPTAAASRALVRLADALVREARGQGPDAAARPAALEE